MHKIHSPMIVLPLRSVLNCRTEAARLARYEIYRNCTVLFTHETFYANNKIAASFSATLHGLCTAITLLLFFFVVSFIHSSCRVQFVFVEPGCTRYVHAKLSQMFCRIWREYLKQSLNTSNFAYTSINFLFRKQFRWMT